jgi:hypothetical protein
LAVADLDGAVVRDRRSVGCSFLAPDNETVFAGSLRSGSAVLAVADLDGAVVRDRR